MKAIEALNQLEMCALGYCDKCVHNGDDCRERIHANITILTRALVNKKRKIHPLSIFTFTHKPRRGGA